MTYLRLKDDRLDDRPFNEVAFDRDTRQRALRAPIVRSVCVKSIRVLL